jgi:multidrug transporter EmrE-like cation transporter
MADQKLPILLNLIAALLGALGQYFYKTGAQKSQMGSIAIGVVLFVGVMALFVLAYRFGGKISVVYPFYATTFVWGALIGVFLEKEPWSNWNLAGLALILGGLTLIASQVRS